MKRFFAFVLAIFAVSSLALAETPPAAGDDPFARYLFPPDRVMDHSQEIGLDDAQFAAIRGEVQKVQPKFLDLQFDMKREAEKLTRLLQERRVDETKVLAVLDRIFALEKQIKTMQMTLLIRIKNTLTPAQQAKLEDLSRGGR